MTSKKAVHIGKTVGLGITSAILYTLLYQFKEEIVDLSQKGGKYFIIPIIIAFVFSLIHGAFTGYFWDVLGLKGKE